MKKNSPKYIGDKIKALNISVIEVQQGWVKEKQTFFFCHNKKHFKN